jgi:heme exporter protein B
MILRVACAIAAKDLRIEVRSRSAVSAVLPFAATILLALGFALGPNRLLLEQTAPGLLWLAGLFASVELCHRSYQAEAANGALEGLLLGPAEKGAVYLGKAVAAFVQLMVLFTITTGIVVVLFGMPVGPEPVLLVLTAALGIAGLSAMGALLGLLAVQGRTRQAALPVIVLPLVTPVIIAATRATAALTQGDLAGVDGWLGLLAAFDVAFLAAGYVVFGNLLED